MFICILLWFYKFCCFINVYNEVICDFWIKSVIVIGFFNTKNFFDLCNYLERGKLIWVLLRCSYSSKIYMLDNVVILVKKKKYILWDEGFVGLLRFMNLFL